ncbi:MAG: 16S rRNA (cytosine(1402)-N(4))-methyltransferase RsmH [Candidatus Omnitrophica bacterium]|nr:16S rRNA (cytosine(1402)-N(4))-methyltransferase RsmH [Candidatus Omnitrophota bacterium]
MVDIYHYPVLYREVLELLLPAKNKRTLVDCTVGLGSHSFELLKATEANVFLIGIDKDQDSLDIANQKLKDFNSRFTLVKDNFLNLDSILGNLNIKEVNVFLFDLGISSYQLNDSQRGFSFLKEGPLDMRMDKNSFLSAYDFINNLSEIELESIFRKFGEERYSRKIAHYLVEARKDEPIMTTAQLSQIIMQAVPFASQYQKIHPATRVFQSLRIAVNRELESLKTGLIKAISFLARGGRVGVISFHSLEDRIVKHTFREYASRGELKIITKTPLVATDLERKENPRSRSAKLRVAERI